MTVKELIAALQQYDDNKTVIVLSDGHPLQKRPVCALTEVSYCKYQSELMGHGYGYRIDRDAELRKCSSCRYPKDDFCKLIKGIGQYMIHPLLIVGPVQSGRGTSQGIVDVEGTIIGEFKKERHDAISELFDNIDAHGNYPLVQFYLRLDKAVERVLYRQKLELEG